jgi:hypothetical protein
VSALAESGRLVEEARRAVTFDERSAASRPSDAVRVALEQQQEGRRLSEALAAADLAELKARVAAQEAAIDEETAELLDDAAIDRRAHHISTRNRGLLNLGLNVCPWGAPLALPRRRGGLPRRRSARYR